MEQSNSVAWWTWRGAGVGTLVAVAAIGAAILSGGAGHGSYIAARVLFPFSMLLTLTDGTIGPVGTGVGLVQFPLYGALIGRALASKAYSIAVLIAAAHLVAALACFSGMLDNFT